MRRRFRRWAARGRGRRCKLRRPGFVAVFPQQVGFNVGIGPAAEAARTRRRHPLHDQRPQRFRRLIVPVRLESRALHGRSELTVVQIGAVTGGAAFQVGRLAACGLLFRECNPPAVEQGPSLGGNSEDADCPGHTSQADRPTRPTHHWVFAQATIASELSALPPSKSRASAQRLLVNSMCGLLQPRP